jgi:hypothetical protein
MKMKGHHSTHDMAKGHYFRLAAMIALSFVAMYILMYAMVDVLGNAVPNFNQAYMAGLMTAPMLVLELLLMGHMYPFKKLNAALIAGGLLLLVACWICIRQQAAIDDKQFLRSMIPHHAGALLMCSQAPIRDTEIKQLCIGILASQQAEIDQMKAKLKALDAK